MADSLMRQALEQMLARFQKEKVEAVLFTTFNFSSSFFESKVLPMLAGNTVDELRETTLAAAQLNEFLLGTRTVVVCDRSAQPDPKGNLENTDRTGC